jgi:hypothetical protein
MPNVELFDWHIMFLADFTTHNPGTRSIKASGFSGKQTRPPKVTTFCLKLLLWLIYALVCEVNLVWVLVALPRVRVL